MTDPKINLSEKWPMAQEQRQTFNIPNTLTLLRISIIPVLFLLLLSPGRWGSLAIAFLFIAAGITDLLDGYIARKYAIITAMGKFLDPIADKLLINTAMIVMIPIGRVPAWIVAVTVIRDLVVDGIRSISSTKGWVIEASPLGKQKTLAQVIAISALIIHYPFLGLDAHLVGTVVLYLALVLTAYSGIDYFIKFYRSLIRNNDR